METEINDYIKELVRKLICNAEERLMVFFLENTDYEQIIEEHFIKKIEKDVKFKNFQEFYFEAKFKYNDNNFFNKFKTHYSLQGVDIPYLEFLNTNRNSIKKLVEDGKLSELYFTFFYDQQIKSKETNVRKNFGSFFTKVVHTFKPEKYTPVDMPMKKDFGLESESYFIALIVISKAFENWANKNRDKMDKLKSLLIERLIIAFPKVSQQKIKDQVTDMKVLDTIFWSVAQEKIKKSKNK